MREIKATIPMGTVDLFGYLSNLYNLSPAQHSQHKARCFLSLEMDGTGIAWPKAILDFRDDHNHHFSTRDLNLCMGIPEIGNDQNFRQIFTLVTLYASGISAASPTQQEALTKAMLEGKIKSLDASLYADEHKAYLQSVNLLTHNAPNGYYTYGQGWAKDKPLPLLYRSMIDIIFKKGD